jgi:hypothetical protein
MGIRPRDILLHMQVPDKPGLYVLGLFEARVTFFSQQVRALNLIYSLWEEEWLRPGIKVAIIGAGGAGLTAAAAAAFRGADTMVLEQYDQLLTLTGQSNKRWLHPHIYEWPKKDPDLPDPLDDNAGLPLLNWQAGTADQVSQHLLRQYRVLADRYHIKFKPKVTNVTILPGDTRRFSLTWNEPSQGISNDSPRRSRTQQCDIVVLAVGFGLERKVNDVPFLSYWATDRLDERDVSIRGRSKRILVSGVGDGGLIDLLRIRFDGFRHDRIVARLNNELLDSATLQWLTDRLLAIEEAAERAVAEQKPYEAKLNEEYQQLSDELTSRVDLLDQIGIRPDTEAVLTSLNNYPLNLGTSILNRLLYSILPDVKYLKAPWTSQRNSDGSMRVTFADGTVESFDEIIVRHGPASALERDFSDIWKQCEPLKARSILDQTRFPIYQDFFDACSPPGSFKAGQVESTAASPVPVPVPASSAAAPGAPLRKPAQAHPRKSKPLSSTLAPNKDETRPRTEDRAEAVFRLRLTASAEGDDLYQAEMAFVAEAARPVIVLIRPGDLFDRSAQEVMRWYLEDYSVFPFRTAHAEVASAEQKMREIGKRLFKALFGINADTRRLWSKLGKGLHKCRIEVLTDSEEVATLPWELMCDPRTQIPLSVRACTFVRSHLNASGIQTSLPLHSSPIRILLVICRPAGSQDVGIRSVASHLIRGLSDDHRAAFQMDVLRPPTYSRLARVLRRAKDEGRAYHVVHFDGHGVHAGPDQLEGLNRAGYIVLNPQPGTHGYLAFENSTAEANVELVDGTRLGSLLVDTEVPVLVVNACNSDSFTARRGSEAGEARIKEAEGPVRGVTADSNSPVTGRDQDIGGAGANEASDAWPPEESVRAFGSLAQEVASFGVPGVVAMRYSILVVTAAQFVEDLYSGLIQGKSLGEAVTLARKLLYDQPRRDLVGNHVLVQDWMVPVVYEPTPVLLFPKLSQADSLSIHLDSGEPAAGRRSWVEDLPLPPDLGFFGRDEAILALDRAFDTARIVLQHAPAHYGKTAVAAEFARWYALTGGVAAPVLFTPFSAQTSLADLLDMFERAFHRNIEQQGIQWPALAVEVRRKVTLEILRRVPALWVWDDVHAVSATPGPNASAPSGLTAFLREARDTRAKFLLVSNTDEVAWVGNLASHVALQPMALPEQFLLARTLAQRQGRRMDASDEWFDLLKLSNGDLERLVTLVNKALRADLKAREQFDAFFEREAMG